MLMLQSGMKPDEATGKTAGCSGGHEYSGLRGGAQKTAARRVAIEGSRGIP
jgi:hypothetical protein